MNKLMAALFNMTGVSWVISISAIVATAMIMVWVITMTELTAVQLVFVVIFPIIFIVIIPAIALMLFLGSTKKTS